MSQTCGVRCTGRAKLGYAYRPVLLEGCQGADTCAQLGVGGALQLPGYGVEMAIKNMEYSALDDAAKVRAVVRVCVYVHLRACACACARVRVRA